MSTLQSRPVIDVTDLCVDFATATGPVRAVDKLSISIQPGSTLAIVGESGSGKSVTSLAIMGLLPPRTAKVTASEIRFIDRSGRSRDLAGISARQMRQLRGDEIAMIFQEPMTSLNPLHTIGNQIAEVLMVHRGASHATALVKAKELLARVGIPDADRRINSYPHEFSGGMRQRVMIAIALACDPSLLIADEPTTALDVTVQFQILSELRRLQRDLGMSMLFITHDLGVVAEMADLVAVMYAGQIVEQGPMREVLKRPRHPYTRGLLNSIPRVDRPRGAQLEAIMGTVADLRTLPTGCRFHPRCRYFEAGRCDTTSPELEVAGPNNHVRCVRWREIAQLESTYA